MPKALPFLRHFSFMVHAVSRRIRDPDLFPAISEFLRGRQQLRALSLVVHDRDVQAVVGFDAAVWGVLPSLLNLKALKISYPADLPPGLAGWLIPRSVRALGLTLEYSSASLESSIRDPIPFLDQLHPGIPPNLRYIGLTHIPVRNVALIVEHSFPMVRVVRVGNNYWTVQTRAKGDHSHSPSGGGTLHEGVLLEMEQWPRRRVAYYATEWLEWLGIVFDLKLDTDLGLGGLMCSSILTSRNDVINDFIDGHSNNVGERGDFKGSSDEEENETSVRISLETIVWRPLSTCSKIDMQMVKAATDPAGNDVENDSRSLRWQRVRCKRPRQMI
ncbi:hypothetical protein AX15_006486 [Amanita polypyramis BW_CC]|nr:hypothetical protein AX15_006486 [Amanita polypyramis BW_CC]